MSFITDWLGISAYARNKKLLGDYSRDKHIMCMKALKRAELPQVSLLKMMEDNQVSAIHDVPEELEYKNGPLVFSDSLQQSHILNRTSHAAHMHCKILNTILDKNLSVIESYSCTQDASGRPFAFYGMDINDKNEQKILKTLSLIIS